MSMFETRLKIEQDGNEKDGPVIYWMSRDQRLNDNWALLYSQKIAIEKNRHIEVIFGLSSSFLNASERSYNFMSGLVNP